MPKFIFWSYIDFIRSEQILLENMKKKLYKSLSIEDMSEITEEHKVMMDRDRKSSRTFHVFLKSNSVGCPLLYTRVHHERLKGCW